MKRGSNLPANLPTLQTGLKQSQSREDVKTIEGKISQHENEIIRNQKVIISLTNDFRLLKDELCSQKKENEELNEMLRKMAENNQKLLASNKELRATIAKM